jgi:hypothetical protein
MAMMFARSLGLLIARRMESTCEIRVNMANMHLG